MGKRTPFFDLHLKANAKIVDFAGWEMPLHYGSQLEEHHHVRNEAGVFDVSHMGIVDLHGSDSIPYLRHLVANDVARLYPGKALYTCMLNEQGGVLDDLIIYQISDDFFRIVVNAGTREKDLNWMRQQTSVNGKVVYDVVLKERLDLAMLAIQGPKVKDKLTEFLSASQAQAATALKPFHFVVLDDLFIARTGYTGEDGYEIILPAEQAHQVWSKLIAAGIHPCGLGARDTLRLEAGLNLYGADMTENVIPHAANLAWTVVMNADERDFIGKQALEQQIKQGVNERLVGLVLEGAGIMRNHQKVMLNNHEVGEITSGGYSPTLEKSIALARVPATIGESCTVLIRNKEVPARVVKPPFVKRGTKMV